MDTIKIPEAIEKIDAAFLTRALSRGRPGVEVTSVHVGTVYLGTATKIRLLLEYNGVGHKYRLPPTMWFKAGFGRPFADIIGNVWLNEARFFSDFAPQIKNVEIPKCYFAASVEGAVDGVILLEDLLQRNVEFYDVGPASVDIAAGILSLQAAYHAVWWNRAELQKLPRSLDLAMESSFEYFFKPEVWDGIVAKPHAAPTPTRLKSGPTMARAVRSMLDLAKEFPDTLIHGDAHIANSYVTADGVPGFLDWQLAGRYASVSDVAYYLITSLSIEDRRRSEKTLLRQYHEALSAGCADAPTYDQLWLGYRRFALHAFCWVAVQESQQPLRRTTAITERAAAAVEDLETLKALEV